MPTIAEAVAANQQRIATQGVGALPSTAPPTQPSPPPLADGPTDRPRRGTFPRSLIASDTFEKVTGQFYGRMRARTLTNPAGVDLPSNAAAIGISKTTVVTQVPVPDIDPFLHFRGSWAASATYLTNDVVIDNLSAYVAIAGSTGVEPDKGNTANWTLLSENLVFNGTYPSQFGAGGFGPIDAAGVVGNSGSSASPTVTAVSSGTFSNEVALVFVSNDNAGFTFTPPAGWNLLYNISGGSHLYWKPIVGGASVTFTATLSGSDDWEALMVFFGFGGFTGFNITQIQTSPSVLTVTAANTLVAGNIVFFSNLATATFLNGQLGVVASATSSQFTVNSVFGNPNYGPTADTGTASLEILQVTALVSGGGGPNAVGFTQATTLGSTFIYTDLWEGQTGGTGLVTALGDNNVPSNIYTFANSGGSGAALGAAQNHGALSTPTILPLGSGLQLSSGAIGFEIPGSVQSTSNFLPYDVVEFRGSIFVCLKVTQNDAFTEPASWGLVGPGTGFTQLKTASYTAAQLDEGNLLSFNSSSNLTLTLPNPLPTVNGRTDSGWWVAVQNLGTGTLTISPSGRTIDGGSSLVLAQNSGCLVFTDGLNFWTVRAASSGSVGGVNSQTVSYLAVPGDAGKLISMNGASLTLTLPATPPNSLWMIDVENLNASNLTINRNGLTIDGVAANLTLGQNQGTIIFTDGTNYFTCHGVNRLTVPSFLTAAAPDGSGSVAISSATVAPSAAVIGPTACSASGPLTARQIQGNDLANLNIASASVLSSTVNQSGNLRLCGSVLPAGLYRISVYMLITDIGAGNLSSTLTWNDGTSSQSVTPASISTTVLGTVAQFDLVVLADGVHDVSYAFTLI